LQLFKDFGFTSEYLDLAMLVLLSTISKIITHHFDSDLFSGLSVNPLEDLAEGALSDGFSYHVTIPTYESAMHLVLGSSTTRIILLRYLCLRMMRGICVALGSLDVLLLLCH
jgi:hypothetical protein